MAKKHKEGTRVKKISNEEYVRVKIIVKLKVFMIEGHSHTESSLTLTTVKSATQKGTARGCTLRDLRQTILQNKRWSLIGDTKIRS